MKRLVIGLAIFVLGLIGLAPRSELDAGPVQLAQSSGAQPDLNAQLEALFEEDNYEEVIRLLSSRAAAEPGNFPVNIILSHAQLKQCERLKAAGDPSYKTLAHTPYNTSQRLYRIDRYHPEPYHIAARALMINERGQKAYQTIKKALYFRPDDPDYLTSLGDILMSRVNENRLGKENDLRIWRVEAEDAYKKASIAAQKREGSSKSAIVRKYPIPSEGTTRSSVSEPAGEKQTSPESPPGQKGVPGASEEQFRTLSEDLKNYEQTAQQGNEEKKSEAWSELVTKYPEWTKDVQPGDVDAVRFRALRGDAGAGVPVAAVPKVDTRETVKTISLRSKPDRNFSENNVRSMVISHNFFNRNYNPRGEFSNAFVDNGNGTVTDRATGLMWQKEWSPSEMDYYWAEKYVQGLNAKAFGGCSDWRVPTLEELSSLLQKEKNKWGQHIDLLLGEGRSVFWSCDEKPPSPGGDSYAVDFAKGDVEIVFKNRSRFSVRAVRTVH